MFYVVTMYCYVFCVFWVSCMYMLCNCVCIHMSGSCILDVYARISMYLNVFYGFVMQSLYICSCIVMCFLWIMYVYGIYLVSIFCVLCIRYVCFMYFVYVCVCVVYVFFKCMLCGCVCMCVFQNIINMYIYNIVCIW